MIFGGDTMKLTINESTDKPKYYGVLIEDRDGNNHIIAYKDKFDCYEFMNSADEGYIDFLNSKKEIFPEPKDIFYEINKRDVSYDSKWEISNAMSDNAYVGYVMVVNRTPIIT